MLSRTQIPRYPLPPPGVDAEPHGAEGLDVGIGRTARFLPVTGVLTTHQITWLQRSHRFEDLRFFGLDRAKIPADGRFHGEERDDLEQVILNHVSQTSRGLVECAPAVHPEPL